MGAPAERRAPRGARAPGAGVVLYDLGPVVVLLLLAAVGLAVLASGPAAREPDRRVVVVTPGGPPGHARIPPGQLKKQTGIVVVATMTPALADRHRLRYQPGILVTEVGVGDGPGTTVLLQRWDVIVAVEGDAVSTVLQLRTRLSRVQTAWTKLTVWRAGRLVTLMVPVDVFRFDG